MAKPLFSLSNLLRIGEASPIDPSLKSRWGLLVELAKVLGLEHHLDSSDGSVTGLDKDSIEGLIEERSRRKNERDFIGADAIRDFLRNNGIKVVDKPGGETVWFSLQ